VSRPRPGLANAWPPPVQADLFSAETNRSAEPSRLPGPVTFAPSRTGLCSPILDGCKYLGRRDDRVAVNGHGVVYVLRVAAGKADEYGDASLLGFAKDHLIALFEPLDAQAQSAELVASARSENPYDRSVATLAASELAAHVIRLRPSGSRCCPLIAGHKSSK